jgi:catechol 2,3-dioxygenase-like lactoylglutathione lyase family enzyme
MITHFDHVTVCVRDLQAARRFFERLGFEQDKAVVISGKRFADYMGVEGLEADHVTLVVPGLAPRLEVQLLHYRHPQALDDPHIARLDKIGFNHICFAVDDVQTMVDRLRADGIDVRGELTGFHGRRLYFITGPEGITVELAQWQ